MAQRMLEVQFGESGAQMREVLAARDLKGAENLLQRMDAAAIGHPWLQDKLQRLHVLASRDAVMAQKELLYSRVKMSSRSSSDEVVARYSDETQRGDVPAYLRRKSSEGTGRKG